MKQPFTPIGLYEAINKLKDEKEIQKFLRDLLTEQEIAEFEHRWTAAQMLFNKLPYSKIKKETGLSSTTVARVSKWLNNGAGGYKIILNRLHHHNDNLSSSLSIKE